MKLYLLWKVHSWIRTGLRMYRLHEHSHKEIWQNVHILLVLLGACRFTHETTNADLKLIDFKSRNLHGLLHFHIWNMLSSINCVFLHLGYVLRYIYSITYTQLYWNIDKRGPQKCSLFHVRNGILRNVSGSVAFCQSGRNQPESVCNSVHASLPRRIAVTYCRSQPPPRDLLTNAECQV